MPPVHFAPVILEMGEEVGGGCLLNYLPGLALNHDPRNLSFPSS
jgi:hypothetical protein